jgi:hypothetical protein
MQTLGHLPFIMNKSTTTTKKKDSGNDYLFMKS